MVTVAGKRRVGRGGGGKKHEVYAFSWPILQKQGAMLLGYPFWSATEIIPGIGVNLWDDM